MTLQEQINDIKRCLADFHQREIAKMGKYLANMDSRGEISREGNFHNGYAQGLQIAIKMLDAVKSDPG